MIHDHRRPERRQLDQCRRLESGDAKVERSGTTRQVIHQRAHDTRAFTGPVGDTPDDLAIVSLDEPLPLFALWCITRPSENAKQIGIELAFVTDRDGIVAL